MVFLLGVVVEPGITSLGSGGAAMAVPAIALLPISKGVMPSLLL